MERSWEKELYKWGRWKEINSERQNRAGNRRGEGWGRKRGGGRKATTQRKMHTCFHHPSSAANAPCLHAALPTVLPSLTWNKETGINLRTWKMATMITMMANMMTLMTMMTDKNIAIIMTIILSWFQGLYCSVLSLFGVVFEVVGGTQHGLWWREWARRGQTPSLEWNIWSFSLYYVLSCNLRSVTTPCLSSPLPASLCLSLSSPAILPLPPSLQPRHPCPTEKISLIFLFFDPGTLSVSRGSHNPFAAGKQISLWLLPIRCVLTTQPK